ncbi:MAG: hypothetical protein QM607_09870 [Microbacterium sp.]
MFDNRENVVYRYPGGHHVIRSQRADGKKIRQRNVPNFTHLWRLDKLGVRNDDETPVIVCEGEKATDAIVKMGHDRATCWPGGGGGVRKVDVTPLQGRNVILIPDKDQAGEAAMSAFARRIHPLAHDIIVWRVPDEVNGMSMPTKADAFEVLEAGGNLDSFIPDPDALAAWLSEPKEERRTGDSSRAPSRRVELTRASDIKTKALRYLWAPFLPLGTVTLFAGRGGEGVSRHARRRPEGRTLHDDLCWP